MNDIRLLDYLDRIGVAYRRISSDSYELLDHDSFRISDSLNTWNWFSRGVGGHGAWDYVAKVEFEGRADASRITQRLKSVMGENCLDDGTTFERTYSSLQGGGSRTYSGTPSDKPVEFKLPTKSTSSRQLLNWITGVRKIDLVVAQAFINSDQLYESNECYKRDGKNSYIHNAVFVRYDKDGVPRAAHKKGIFKQKDGKYYRADVPGSDKANTPFLHPKTIPESATTLVVFEAEIDLMSYLTLQRAAGRVWNNYNCMSLGGVAKTNQISMGMATFLDTHPNITTVVLALDTDEVGKAAAEGMKEALIKRGIKNVRIIEPKYPGGTEVFHDWNDALIAYKALSEDVDVNKTPASSETPHTEL